MYRLDSKSLATLYLWYTGFLPGWSALGRNQEYITFCSGLTAHEPVQTCLEKERRAYCPYTIYTGHGFRDHFYSCSPCTSLWSVRNRVWRDLFALLWQFQWQIENISPSSQPSVVVASNLIIEQLRGLYTNLWWVSITYHLRIFKQLPHQTVG